MTPTRARWLLLLGVVTAVVTWLVLRQVYTDLAPLPWTPVPTLVLLGLVEAWAGRGLRARLAGRGRAGQNGNRPAVRTRPLSPIAIARAAALAKARPDRADTIARQLKRLTAPDQMGELFKVAAIWAGPPPPAFEDAA